ncbi:putative sugar nucleotidyl transferase [Lewinella sp. IMCC34191]|uniref:putative sugar nucleotidyl transferase n=1 Tax=Lewinella sp. IMCC34191 TaxID=2259172 RepID=UPI000E24B4E3|nr:putative sugar nucleotidyl transferase [Lewinella sp. IMCC34191]
MPVILFDSQDREHLLPLTYARPVGDLRLGLLTLAEKWGRHLVTTCSCFPAPYLRNLFPTALGEENWLIDGSLLPGVEVVSWIESIPLNSAWAKEGRLVVAKLDRARTEAFVADDGLNGLEMKEVPHLPFSFVSRPADLFRKNAEAIVSDFELVTGGRDSEPLPSSNRLVGSLENLFISNDVKLEACILNVEDGPIYIGRGATVLEGSMLRGPLVIAEDAVIKMGAKLYGATTIGPNCKVGGEISNVVFQANSNKGHDGYLGNAVVGEWCNIGADTNGSNLKNDYGNVKVWSYADQAMIDSGIQFYGIIMGDHSKTAINTMLNTGTVIGFSANVFGAGFPPTFVPSFTWGNGVTTYRLDKAMETARRMMMRRGKVFSDDHRALFEYIFQRSQPYRRSD